MFELLVVIVLASSQPSLVGETLHITRYNSDCTELKLVSTGFEIGERTRGREFIEYAGSFKEYVCTDGTQTREVREIIELRETY